jgi:hypothetical protein
VPQPIKKARQRKKETPMRTILLAAIAAAALPLTSTGARAAPWCAHYGTDSGTNCGFYTIEQCQAALAGAGKGYCAPNQFEPPYPAPSAAQIGSKPVLSKVHARTATKSTNLQTRSSVQLGKETKAAARAKYTVAGRTAPLPPAQLPDTAKPVTEKAKASIAAMLLNPASAEFYNLKRAVKKMLDEPVDTICGYVKGKNASSGDTEEMPFLYIVRDDREGEAYLVDGRSYVAQTVHGVLCK